MALLYTVVIGNWVCRNEDFHNADLKIKSKIGTLTTLKGGTKEIIEGQMLLVMGNPTEYGNAFDLDLILLLRSSRLVNSFPVPLPTFDQIGLAIYMQQLKLKGKYDALIGDATSNENLQMWKFGKGKNKKQPGSPAKAKSFLGGFFTNE